LEIPISSHDTPSPSVQSIPSWIKNNAGWWADGSIDDSSFVQGIQFLIKEGIMKIPPTTQGTGTGSSTIPSWIKNNAGWWADGSIDDSSFVQGIQFLIKEGIMKVPTPKTSTSSGSEPESWFG
ncbi:MAG: peptidase, partial [Nitrosarchaeum sp.]|nr:peptidase [Nitrosarchaeum sp.]